MKTIYKYKLANVYDQFVELPRGAEVLSAQVQRDEIRLWALVDSGATKTDRRAFRIHGTGHSIPDVERLSFIDTVQLSGGALIFHVFEVDR